jgi:exonuclease SbcD
MRLLHTSDWHLGRLFHGVHLTEDQAWVLDDFVRAAIDLKPDVIVIAGDLYDRAVPPPAAVALLDEVLTRLALDVGAPVVAMAGNHDSPDRIGFGRRLMNERGVHLFGQAEADPFRVSLPDPEGLVDLFVWPFVEPVGVRVQTGDESIVDQNACFAHAVSRANAAKRPGARNVFVAHAFVAGGTESESERPLSVGGTGAVAPHHFEGFDYVALGHLHRPQSVGSPRVRYSGSLLKYSFSEADHVKSVSLVELAADGSTTVEEVPLRARRDVHVLKGSLSEILAWPLEGKDRQDYICAELTDEGAILDAKGRIQEVWPNCVNVTRTAFLREIAGDSAAARVDHRQRSDVDLFSDFFADVTDQALTDEERTVVHSACETLQARERESAPKVLKSDAAAKEESRS